MTHYKLVRDDFKADKVRAALYLCLFIPNSIWLNSLQSVLHVVHCCVMIAACQFLMDPMANRGRELISHLEAVKECFPSILDVS